MAAARSLLGGCPLYMSGMIPFSLIVDLAKFMTVLFLFLVGFSFLITAMNTPFFDTTEVFYLFFTFSCVLYITTSKGLMSSKLNWLRPCGLASVALNSALIEKNKSLLVALAKAKSYTAV
jgi:hypothetical protein